MKFLFVFTGVFTSTIISCQSHQSAPVAKLPKDSTLSAQQPIAENLYIDVHHMGAGNVSYEAVAGAHTKDLATQGKYGTQFIKFWVDEAKGDVYCLSKAPNPAAIISTHKEAHGLLPQEVFEVSDGPEASISAQKNFFLDVHNLGAGKVTAKDVAQAHQKDLTTQKKYGVNFVNYWVDEKAGRVICLSQAADSSAIIKTHKEAHGLLPDYVIKVKQGQ